MSVFKYICNAIIALANAVARVFGYMIIVHCDKVEKQKEQEKRQQEASQDLQEACDNGTLDDLIDATKKIGDARR